VQQVLASEQVVPSFSAVALKLTTMVRDDRRTLDDFAAVIALDPGLAARCIKVAGTVAYRGRSINTIKEALLMIGMTEMRRIALSIGVMDAFSHLRIKIDWQRFWLHSVLVARIGEKIAGAYREVTGIEYLAGLLHDSGKMILEHYFPREFETVVLTSMERRCGHASVESDILGINHAQIGGALCEVLKIHPHAIEAVRFHHDVLNPAHVQNPTGDGGFLAACVNVADMFANMARASIGGERVLDRSYEEYPEWKFLLQFAPENGLDLDLEEEITRTDAELKALN
jgi:HD-like signal output (HDOD) protein